MRLQWILNENRRAGEEVEVVKIQDNLYTNTIIRKEYQIEKATKTQLKGRYVWELDQIMMTFPSSLQEVHMLMAISKDCFKRPVDYCRPS